MVQVKNRIDRVQTFDFTGSLLHGQIRMVRKDVMVGKDKYSTTENPIFKALGRSIGFIMKDDNRECFPHLLKRI
jgi:hypothetical protein